jgi:hypothetical protein
LAKERFAIYGFELEVPDDWRVEVNPKGTRKKGDVAFHTSKGNRFFISWGDLESANKRFKTLDEHRDWSTKQVGKGPDVKKVNVEDSREVQIGGHRALLSHVTADVRAGGFMSRGSMQRSMWSVHFYCPEQNRYYVIYSLQRDPEEFPDFSSAFDSLWKTAACHRKIEASQFA